MNRSEQWAAAYGSMGIEPQVRLMQLPLHILDPWGSDRGEQQPFKPYTTQALQELADNIRRNGVIEPITVRPKPNSRFEIIAGHNRTAAAKLAGLTTIPAQVMQLDDDEAALRMVDSNLQHRETLLPSEKAFAYKVRLDSLKRQGQRTDLTSGQVVPKLKSGDSPDQGDLTSAQLGQKLKSGDSPDQGDLTSAQVGQKFDGKTSRTQIAENSPDSSSQIQRYIRLTYLIPDLLQRVDEGRIAFIPGAELSYLSPNVQTWLAAMLRDKVVKKISLDQSKQLRQLAESTELTEEVILQILCPVKRKKPETIKLPMARIGTLFSPEASVEEIEETIYEALKKYMENNTPTSV